MGSPADGHRRQININDTRSYTYQPEQLAREHVHALQDSSPFPRLPSFYEDSVRETWQKEESLRWEKAWKVQREGKSGAEDDRADGE